MGDTTTRWMNSKLTLTMRDSRGLETGKIEALAGTNARSVIARVTARITAAAAKTGGLTEAQQLALLGAISLSFGYMKGNSNLDTRPFTDLSFAKLRRIQNLLMETEVVGFKATTGMQKALTSGANIITWDSVIPLGHVEFMDESSTLGGMGDAELRLADLTLKTAGEPLKALDADLECTEISVEFFPDNTATMPGVQRWGIPVHYDTIINSDAQFVETKPGLVLYVADVAQPLSGSLFQAIRVSVGGYGAVPPYIPTDEPSTPKEVEANFAVQPDSGTVEKAVNLSVTPLYRQSDKPLGKMNPGHVRIHQVTKVTGFNIEYLYIPILPMDYFLAAAKACAARLQPGETAHLVSSASVEGLTVRDALLPYVGFHWVKSNHELAMRTAGLRCDHGGEPYVWAPPVKQYRAGQEYGAGAALGDGGAMLKAVRSISDDIPGAVGHPLGYAGGETWVYRQVVEKLRATANAISANSSARG